MIRRAGPVALSTLATVLLAQTGVADDFPKCDTKKDEPVTCARVLACVGQDGLWFDGAAFGWNKGEVFGALSNGVPCVGNWDSEGPFGTGHSEMTCSDGTEAHILYFRVDSATGTTLGHGLDNRGRTLRVWTGTSVLNFLTDSETGRPMLPCMPDPLLLTKG